MQMHIPSRSILRVVPKIILYYLSGYLFLDQGKLTLIYQYLGEGQNPGEIVVNPTTVPPLEFLFTKQGQAKM